MAKIIELEPRSDPSAVAAQEAAIYEAERSYDVVTGIPIATVSHRSCGELRRAAALLKEARALLEGVSRREQPRYDRSRAAHTV